MARAPRARSRTIEKNAATLSFLPAADVPSRIGWALRYTEPRPGGTRGGTMQSQWSDRIKRCHLATVAVL